MQIKELKIYSNQLAEQTDFYSNILGLKCIKMSEKQVSFQVGSSILTIQSREKATPYHFAINIPSNKENEALAWLKERVEILKDDQIEIHDFDFWNAKAVYFYDRDRNIVELIARKNLQNHSETPFDSNHLLNISEIGIPTTSIEEKYTQLTTISGVPKFSGGFDRMLTLGDERGLFICINKEIKDWFPTGDKAHSSDFELRFTEKKIDYRIQFNNDEITVLEA